MSEITEQSVLLAFSEAKGEHTRANFLKRLALTANNNPELMDVAVSVIKSATTSTSPRVRAAAQVATRTLVENHPDLAETFFPLTKIALMDMQDLSEDHNLSVSYYTQESFSALVKNCPELLTTDFISDIFEGENYDSLQIAITARPDLVDDELAAKIVTTAKKSDNAETLNSILSIIASKRPDLVSVTIVKHLTMNGISWETTQASHPPILDLIEKRPDHGPTTLACIFQSIRDKKNDDVTLASRAFELLPKLTEKQPSLVDDSLIESLVYLTVETEKFHTFSISQYALSALTEILKQQPDFTQLAYDTAKPYLKSHTDAQDIFKHLIDTQPQLLDADMAREAAECAMCGGKRSYERASARKNLDLLIDKRPDLFDAEWIDTAIKKGAAHGNNEVRDDAHKVLGVLLKKHPERANEDIALAITKTAATDIWWRTRETAQENLAFLAEERPDLITSASKFSFTEEKDRPDEIKRATQKTKKLLAEKRSDIALMQLMRVLQALPKANP